MFIRGDKPRFTRGDLQSKVPVVQAKVHKDKPPTHDELRALMVQKGWEQKGRHMYRTSFDGTLERMKFGKGTLRHETQHKYEGLPSTWGLLKSQYYGKIRIREGQIIWGER